MAITIKMEDLSKEDFRHFAEILIYSEHSIETKRESSGYMTIEATKTTEEVNLTREE